MDNDHAALLNGMRKGFDDAMGFQYTKATLEEVCVEFAVSDVHLQQYGLVHGGVYAGLIEVMCSVGAAMNAMARGQSGAVGLDNNTSFLRAVRSGTLKAVARPLTRGQRTQVWEAEVRDSHGRLCAKGRVRLLNTVKGDDVAGDEIKV
ncbi:MAG: PaaI family thioesterase [Myxococcota bacterium]